MPYGIIVVVLILLLLFSTFRVLNEYERGVMLTLGRYTGTKGPGIVMVLLTSPKRDSLVTDRG